MLNKVISSDDAKVIRVEGKVSKYSGGMAAKLEGRVQGFTKVWRDLVITFSCERVDFVFNLFLLLGRSEVLLVPHFMLEISVPGYGTPVSPRTLASDTQPRWL